MSQNDDLDPAANTQMFQAFVDRAEPEEKSRWLWMVLVAAGVVLVGVLAWLLLG
jgi:hypothetical protein